MTRGYMVALGNKIVSSKYNTIEEAEIALQNHHILDLVSGGTDDERQYKIITPSEYDFYTVDSQFGSDQNIMCKLEKVVTSRRKTTVSLDESLIQTKNKS